jgi:crotonobetainyl-CoA:carnitine CoA-transferase CaiB-like acyl-CoA transferase
MGKDGAPTQESAYYLAANRNKRSVAVDITTKDGAEFIRDLAAHCDVLIENFKVGGLAKYGLDYASIAEVKPDIIYCSISGYGQTGPQAHLPGYDIMAQGFGGIMSLTGDPEGTPVKVGVGIADVMCGMYACTAILTALHHRTVSGEGQHIDIALVDSQIAWLINEGTNYLLSGEEPARRGNQHPNIVPYQSFETRDGHVLVAVGNDGQFQRFCVLLGLLDVPQDARFATNSARLANREPLIDLLAEVILTRGKAELLEAMGAANVPGGPINTVPEVFDSAQVAAREMKIAVPHARAGSGQVELIGNPVKFSKTPVSYRRAPPACGEHTEDVMSWLAEKQRE